MGRGDLFLNPELLAAAIKTRLASLDRRRTALAALAIAMALSTAVVLWWTRGRTFALDEWSRIVTEHGWSPESLLRPENGHLIASFLAPHNLILELFGLTSYLPFQLFSILLTLLISFLLYVIARRRLGPFLGLVPALLILFFGAGWEIQLNGAGLPSQLCAATGLGTLIALERQDLKGDIAAFGLLLLCLGSFSYGVAFAAGAAAELVLRGRGVLARRWWVFGVPLALYAAWFLWSRQHFPSEVGEAGFSAASVGSIVTGIANQLAAICAGITGLFRTPSSADLAEQLSVPVQWGIPFALGLVGLVVLRFRVAPRPSPRFSVALAIVLVYLIVLGAALSPARTANASRYVWIGSILVLLLLVELAAGLRLARGLQVAIWAALSLSLIGNVAQLHTAGLFFRSQSEYNRAELGALDLVRDRVPADFPIETPSSSFLPHYNLAFPASEYFSAAARFGSVAYSESQLAAAAEGPRDRADQLMARALSVSAASVSRPATPDGVGAVRPEHATDARVTDRGRCVLVKPRRGSVAKVDLRLPPGGIAYSLASAAQPSVRLRRFGSVFSVDVAMPHGAGRLTIPTDRSPRRWHAALSSPVPLTVCPS